MRQGLGDQRDDGPPVRGIEPEMRVYFIAAGWSGELGMVVIMFVGMMVPGTALADFQAV